MYTCLTLLLTFDKMTLCKTMFGGCDHLWRKKYMDQTENLSFSLTLMTCVFSGFLRNVVTGDHYRFVSMWMARSSYLAAAFIMLVFVSYTFYHFLFYSYNKVYNFLISYWYKSYIINLAVLTDLKIV